MLYWNITKKMIRSLKLMTGKIILKIKRGCFVTPCETEFDKQMRLAKKGMARYRNTLRALSRL